MIGNAHGCLEAGAKRRPTIKRPRARSSAGQVATERVVTMIAKHDQAGVGVERADQRAHRAIEAPKSRRVLGAAHAMRVGGHVATAQGHDRQRCVFFGGGANQRQHVLGRLFVLGQRALAEQRAAVRVKVFGTEHAHALPLLGNGGQQRLGRPFLAWPKVVGNRQQRRVVMPGQRRPQAQIRELIAARLDVERCALLRQAAQHRHLFGAGRQLTRQGVDEHQNHARSRVLLDAD